MPERTSGANGSSTTGGTRWWRISEHEWYKLVMAALTLVATAFGVFFAIRQVWPEPEPSQPVKNNYAILVDHSETMAGMLGDKTKLENATEKILDTVHMTDGGTTARGLWYFGGSCGEVAESVSLRPNNAPIVRAALASPPPAHGDRPLVHALDAAVSELASVPVRLGDGDVKTVRRIVVFTDGPDGCDDDLSRVTTSLDDSAIQVEFHIVGIDLAPTDRQILNELAQSLPGVDGGPATVTEVASPEELTDAAGDALEDDLGDPDSTTTTSVVEPDDDTTTTTESTTTTTTTTTGDV